MGVIMHNLANSYPEEFDNNLQEELYFLVDQLDRVRPATFVKRFKKIIQSFGLKTLTLQEFALDYFNVEPEQLTIDHLRKAYKILYPFLKRGFIGRISNENELKRMESDKPLYCFTQKGLCLIRLVDPLFMNFLTKYAFFNEALFFVPFEEAKKELCSLLGHMRNRTAKRVLPYKYKVGKNIIVLKSDSLENWQKKYPQFPLLTRQQVLGLFPRNGYAVTSFLQKLLDKAVISADEIISYFDSEIISQKVKGLEELTKEQNEAQK